MDGPFYGKHTNVEFKPLGGLAVITPMLQRMGVEQFIDQHIPAATHPWRRGSVSEQPM